jgi:hypothetical protein
MPLTNFSVQPFPEVDDCVVLKADDGKERVVAEIPRRFLDDYFPHRSLTSEKRRTLVLGNLDAIGSTMSRKYEAGEWRPEPRYGSTIRRIDFSMADLQGGPQLSDASLIVEEGARFQRPLR